MSAPRVRPGDYVRMGGLLKLKLNLDGSREHVAEFGACVGIVLGPVDFGNGVFGPEVNVRWLPSGLRYAYHPRDLVADDRARADALLVTLANRAEVAAVAYKKACAACRADPPRALYSRHIEILKGRADAYFVALAEADRALAR